MLTPLLTGNFLRKKRIELGLTQRQLAARMEVDPRRVCDWENARRLPAPAQQVRLAGILKLTYVKPVECASRAVTAGRPSARTCLPDPDREMGVRLRAVKDAWPELYRAFERRLVSRADRAAISRYLVDASAGSKYEALLQLRVLVDEGRASRVAPLHAGFRTRSVIDPSTSLVVGDRRVPCLETRLAELDLLLIPQVSVQVLHKQKLRAITPDLLVRVDGKRWAIVEVNGTGHDGSEDLVRSELAGVPVVYMEGTEVQDARCLDILADRLVEKLREWDEGKSS